MADLNVTTTLDAILQATNTVFRPATKIAKTYEVFDHVAGFQWDKMRWTVPRTMNTDATIPALMDPVTTGLPDSIFQSGIGDKNDIKLLKIEDMKNSVDRWVARVTPGTYFVHRDRYWLYSEDSIIDSLGRDVDTDGNSRIDLWFEPLINSPITAAYLTYDSTGDIQYQNEFVQVDQFTGLRVNGVELDPSLDISNADTSLFEFRTTFNLGSVVEDEALVVTVDASDIGTVILAGTPLSVYPLEFTHPDIFVRELSFDAWIDGFRNSTLVVGDYYIGYRDSVAPSGAIQVFLPVGGHPSYGCISYSNDYPANLSFNGNRALTRTVVAIGTTDGSPSQGIFLDIFPAFDETSLGVLDTWSFSLFVNAVEYTRVADFSVSGPGDLHFTLDAEYGIVRLGNGPNGIIPLPALAITATYDAVPFIQYEPMGASGSFRDRELNLDPVTNSLDRGFIYLSNRLLQIDHLHLEAPNHSINPLTGNYGPLQAGLDLMFLLGKVHDVRHDGVPNIDVDFFNPDASGQFVAASRRTNQNGEAYAQFLTDGDVESYMVDTHLYQPVPGLDLAADAVGMLATADPGLVGTTEILDVNPGGGAIWAGDGAAWTNNTLVVPKVLTGTTANTYVFVVENTDVANTYNNNLRTGGRSTILAYINAQGSWSVLHPVAVTAAGGTTNLVFDRELRTKDTTVSPHIERQVHPTQVPAAAGFNTMKFRSLSDREVTFYCQTVNSPILASNSLVFDVQIANRLLGEYTLPTPTDSSGSGIGGAVWLFLNSEMRVDSILPISGGIAGGTVVTITGDKMPVDAELKPNVWLTSATGVQTLIADAAVTQSADGRTMTVTMPAMALGTYELVVGWRRPETVGPNPHQITFATYDYI